MADRQQDERSIFLAAIEINSADERKMYLDGVCGNDPKLRADVGALLREHATAQGLLDVPDVVTATIDFPPIVELPGTQIGPYKLLEQIGEGGMGVVYHASQREPVRRTVALKIIKPGMDSREVVKRFEAERQALAMMDHPNIAKVFDGGVTGAGRPYFAMELVRGKPITEYCDREQLSTRERLTLFVAVCRGVQHAHQKGIIHRDLKPSNILIKVYDVRPVPVVIDFGIAKAVGQQLSEQSLHTAFDQMVGTPLYMSPEQAGQSGLDVDTRSDIYSLGVLLYELLTGYTPFEKDSLRTVGVDEMRRIIREVDPPRPSARVSTLQAADLSTISERRHVEPGKLSQQLRGELDWIVMKALDKDRDRRYATANDLAADVERYLHDEPVQACPPSATYRFAKFARRNQVALVTSALFALLLIVGTGVSVWQAIRATNAEVAAITERDAKERAEKIAIAERDQNKQLALRATRAEQRTAQALLTAQDRLQFGRQAVDDMYTQFAEKWLAQQAELTVVQREFLEKALAFYQRLATEESADPEVLFEAAIAEQRVAAIQSKLEQHTEAEAAYRRAIALFEQLAREAQEPAKYKLGLAWTRSGLGGLLLFTGRPQEAEQEQRLAFTLFQSLATQFPDDAQYQRDLARSHDRLGQVLRGIGKIGEAQEVLRQGIALFQSLLQRSPDDHALKFELAQSQAHLAPIIGDTSPTEADRIYRAVASSAAELVAADPTNPEYRDFQAEILQSWGGVLLHFFAERLPEAEAILRQALAIREGLARDFPQVPRYRCSLAHALGNLGSVLRSPTQSEESEQLQRRSLEIMEKLATAYPKVPDYRSSVGAGANNIALLLMDRGDWAEARQLLEQAIVHQTAALEINPGASEYSIFLSAHLENLTQVQLALDDATAAARTAEAWAHHINRKTECRALRAALHGELMIANAETAQRPDNDPQRREYVVAECYMIFRALVKDAAQQSLDDPDQFHIADLLTTAPEPLRDPDLALKLARRAVELKPNDGHNMRSLGWALYRSGDYRGSLEASGHGPDAGQKDFVPAMALWQLGEKAEAQAHFLSDSEWLKGYEQRCEEKRKQRIMSTPLPVQLKRLQAEAAALLGVTLPTIEPAPAPAAKVEEAQELPKSTPTPEAAKEEEPPK